MTKGKESEDAGLARLERILADHEKRISTIENRIMPTVENKRMGQDQISKGIIGTMSTLIQEGFFREKRTIAEVQEALAARGYSRPTSSLSGPLQELVRSRSLNREKLKTNGRAQWIYWSRDKAQRK
jgi:hypothetical protein